MRIKYVLLLQMLLLCTICQAQKNDISVIAYYTGGNDVDSFALEKLTHIIFSFCHLKENKLYVSNARDTAMIQRLVDIKKRLPNLKVMLALGGWGGCATCSDVFSTKRGRREFARSVKQINNYFGTDGLDLDWEYPAISGYPNHRFHIDDKKNFTALVTILRRKLGSKHEISFAAGGFKKFIETSIEWKKVMKKVDRVNLMTYDLVSGYSTVTGHHTPLYSTARNPESVHNAVNLLQKQGVANNKIVIGAAFYGRMWEAVEDSSSGLYRQGKFKTSIASRDLAAKLSPDSGFVAHWDSTAHASYLYNPVKNLFITYDDERSVGLKTQYVIDKGLGGIMFWQLRDDAYNNGLLNAIDAVKYGSKKQVK
ncbi:MAG: Chitinase [Ferruginibacter sp.]|nr:Chitinase [Ferruginibacter sp.]